MAIFESGTCFANHFVVRLLGEGRVAEVYEVIDPEGALRAFKLVKGDPDLTSKLLARLVQEAEAIAAIDHVNVVRFFDAGIEGGRVWIRIELVRGADLRQRMKEAGGRLPVARAVRLLRQVCDGVAAAHERAILHRDLEPGNILVTDDDTAKIADFGSAKLARHGVKTAGELDVSSSLSRAPEYARTGLAEPASDVYSLGLVLYEALSGQHPIGPATLSPAEVHTRQMTYEPRPLATLGLDIPADVSDLVQWALAKDPARRCSLPELKDGLTAALRWLQVRRRAAAGGVPLPGRGVALARTEPGVAAVGRSAVLPPEVPVPPSPLPSTLRVPVARTLPMEAVGAPADRRSTAAPVERAAPAAAGERRRIGPAIGLTSVLLAGALAAVGWSLAGRGGAGGAEAASGAGTTATTPSATATTSASAPRPRPTPVPRRGPAKVPVH